MCFMNPDRLDTKQKDFQEHSLNIPNISINLLAQGPWNPPQYRRESWDKQLECFLPPHT